MSDIQAEEPTEGPRLRYRRVAGDICHRIETGELRPGAWLMSERGLAEYYGVAFRTVRDAIEILRDEGLIETVHGSGNYVKDAPS
jgi:GntR family transcriptional regulator